MKTSCPRMKTSISKRDKHKTLKSQEMLKIQTKLTGTFARNTSLRVVNALPSYIKGKMEESQK